jgi:hypothetical protein
LLRQTEPNLAGIIIGMRGLRLIDKIMIPHGGQTERGLKEVTYKNL